MLTADDFRQLVLALDGAIESSHMGHPDFRANGRIFATLHTNETCGMVKLLPDEQRVLLRSHPDDVRPIRWRVGTLGMYQRHTRDG